jgi:hypothetical protein
LNLYAPKPILWRVNFAGVLVMTAILQSPVTLAICIVMLCAWFLMLFLVFRPPHMPKQPLRHGGEKPHGDV